MAPLQFRAPRCNNALRLLEVVLLAAGTVALMLLLSYGLGTCVDVPAWHEKNYGFTLKCDKGARSPVWPPLAAQCWPCARLLGSHGDRAPCFRRFGSFALSQASCALHDAHRSPSFLEG